MRVNGDSSDDFGRALAAGWPDLSKLDGKTILITGATGLIGSTLVRFLARYAETAAAKPRILALVRSPEKAARVFGGELMEQLDCVVGDVTVPMTIDGSVDYIIHGASQTSSRSFVSEPVETIQTALRGTANMLELAREKKVKSFVYLSSMEVYGAPQTATKIGEANPTNLDTMAIRSSYPESKRMCEALCAAYCSEYGVPSKVIRLTQTIGPGVAYEDGRVFAEFARCVIENRDIVLHTLGQTKRSYLYTVDAATAILTVLLAGENGQAYNAANEDTYCSIVDLGRTALAHSQDRGLTIRIEADNDGTRGYAPTLHMNLDTSKLRRLGWRPAGDLSHMFETLIASMRYDHEMVSRRDTDSN